MQIRNDYFKINGHPIRCISYANDKILLARSFIRRNANYVEYGKPRKQEARNENKRRGN